MAAFKEFHRYVLPYMANAPVPAVNDELRIAAIEFCERTDCINAVLDPLPIVAGEPLLDIEVPSTLLVVHRALNVTSPFGRLTPKTKRELANLFPGGWTLETTDQLGGVAYWISLAREQVRLVPSPTFSAGDSIVIEASYKPGPTVSELPDYLLNHYPRAIAAGAMARLHAHKNAGYADPSRVEFYQSAFDAAVKDAADESGSGVGKPERRMARDEFV